MTCDPPALRQLRAGRVAVGEDDAPRRIDLQHLAGHLDAVVVADEHPSAGPRVDGGAGAPPRRPERAVGEVLEDGVDGRADVDGAIEEVREGGHGRPLRGGLCEGGGTGRAGTRAAPRLAQLGVQLEPPERVAPDALQLLPDRAERVAAGAVVAETALGADGHEPGVRQGLQLQRHGAERDVGHRRVDVPGAALLVPHQPQDLLPPGRREHGQDGQHRRHVNILVKTKLLSRRHETAPESRFITTTPESHVNSGSIAVADRARTQTLNLNRRTSPSATTYSLPSMR